MVLRARGTKLVKSPHVIDFEGELVPSNMADGFAALRAVARWLGYRNQTAYNIACEETPGLVKKQLREAK